MEATILLAFVAAYYIIKEWEAHKERTLTQRWESQKAIERACKEHDAAERTAQMGAPAHWASDPQEDNHAG